jgi:hypothetical protein
MRALPWVTGVITEYQRDSSSKRPMSSVTLATRVRHRLWNLPRLWTLKNAPTTAWKTTEPFSTAPTGT